MAGPRSVRWMELLGTQVIRLPSAEVRGGRWLGHLVAGGMVLAGSALLASWVHVQNIAVRYQYSRAYRTQQERTQILNALEVERQMLRRPERIVRIAEKDLGMKIPSVEDQVAVK